MRIVGIAALLFAAIGSAHGQTEGDFPPPVRERIEWCDIWFTDANKDELPRVLLIGDSITRGYFGGVENALEGEAYCGRLTTSRSVCDPVFFQELALVLGQYQFNAIHFNNGLHGWDYEDDDYKEGFARFVDTLKEQAPGARLICATSTPVQEEGGMAEHAERVVVRNRMVMGICDEEEIPINDLYEAMSDHPEYFTKDGVHFNNEGRAVQAERVADAIEAALGGGE